MIGEGAPLETQDILDDFHDRVNEWFLQDLALLNDESKVRQDLERERTNRLHLLREEQLAGRWSKEEYNALLKDVNDSMDNLIIKNMRSNPDQAEQVFRDAPEFATSLHKLSDAEKMKNKFDLEQMAYEQLEEKRKALSVPPENLQDYSARNPSKSSREILQHYLPLIEDPDEALFEKHIPVSPITIDLHGYSTLSIK